MYPHFLINYSINNTEVNGPVINFRSQFQSCDFLENNFNAPTLVYTPKGVLLIFDTNISDRTAPVIDLTAARIWHFFCLPCRLPCTESYIFPARPPRNRPAGANCTGCRWWSESHAPPCRTLDGPVNRPRCFGRHLPGCLLANGTKVGSRAKETSISS